MVGANSAKGFFLKTLRAIGFNFAVDSFIGRFFFGSSSVPTADPAQVQALTDKYLQKLADELDKRGN
jgi:hypothetical protein